MEYFIGVCIGVLGSICFWFSANEIKILCDKVSDLRAERKELLEHIERLRRDVCRTQEDVNDYYQWRKERGKG
jgi:uncharacterized coiled-coil DUF342 family protein